MPFRNRNSDHSPFISAGDLTGPWTITGTNQSAAELAKANTVNALYTKQFLRADGTDMRDVPMVEHPVTGHSHFDHGYWPTNY